MHRVKREIGRRKVDRWMEQTPGLPERIAERDRQTAALPKGGKERSEGVGELAHFTLNTVVTM